MRNLFAFLAIVLVAALIGSLGSSYGVQQWYPGLTRPIFSPPNWIFPPMWTLLYVTIAVSGWLFWKDSFGSERIFPMLLWSVQLILNALWPWIFFYGQNPLLALWDIALLWIFILLTMISFWPVQRYATIALFPYLAWVSFTAVLTFWLTFFNAN